MNKKIVLGSCILLVSLIGGLAPAGVKMGDNPTSIGASSLLELESTNTGLVLSRVADITAIANPMNGMLIYDLSDNRVKGYQNGIWSSFVQSTGGGGGGGGVLDSLDCAAASLNTGTLTENTAASGVTSSLLYTGGGNTYSTTSVSSTGVTGLTAALQSYAYDPATDGGVFVYSITGTPTANGTASFAFDIGGQNCTLNRVVSTALAPSALTLGTGTLSGRTCFDIALGNGCGAVASRAVQKADFTLPAIHTQTYTFTPAGTVSNVRFYYVNEVGNAVVGITGGNSGNNISTAQTATVNYNTDNNTLALGLTNSNALKTKIYAVYNNNPTNNNTASDDRIVALTAYVKDCPCCGAYIANGEWKEFLCHNLGADISLDPHDMTQANAWGLQGAYIQWGKRGPNITGDSRIDWQTAPSDGPNGFGAAPSASNPNAGSVANWLDASPTYEGSSARYFDWQDNIKTVNDPCPSGYRVPTAADWIDVYYNNTLSSTGTWSASSYGSAVHFGPDANTKTLTLPAAGVRYYSNTVVTGRGQTGAYWSAGPDIRGITSRSAFEFEKYTAAPLYVRPFVSNYFDYSTGLSVRCIAE